MLAAAVSTFLKHKVGDNAAQYFSLCETSPDEAYSAPDVSGLSPLTNYRFAEVLGTHETNISYTPPLGVLIFIIVISWSN